MHHIKVHYIQSAVSVTDCITKYSTQANVPQFISLKKSYLVKTLNQSLIEIIDSNDLFIMWYNLGKENVKINLT